MNMKCPVVAPTAHPSTRTLATPEQQTVLPSGAMIRSFLTGEPGSYRNSSGQAAGAAVRCLKN